MSGQDDKYNGRMSECGIYGRSDKLFEYFEKVDAMEQVMQTLCENSTHLECLPEIKNKLLDSATGRDHWDSKTVRMLVWIMGGMIFSLLFMLVFLATGHKLGISDLQIVTQAAEK